MDIVDLIIQATAVALKIYGFIYKRTGVTCKYWSTIVDKKAFVMSI